MIFKNEKKAFFLLYFIGLVTISNAQIKDKFQIPKVKFVNSALGDYLYYLFNRKQISIVPVLDSILKMQEIPKLGALIALPEIVTAKQTENYQDIYRMIDLYYKNPHDLEITYPHQKKIGFSYIRPTADSINRLVKLGYSRFPAFKKIWQDKFKAVENNQIKAWKSQLNQLKVLEKFNSLTKLSFRSKEILIAAMIFHPAGSANYNPSSIYTGLFKEPDLAWVIGHEGTHLLLSGPKGHLWANYPFANELIKLAYSNGILPNDIEEALCHYMQAKLSRMCGLTISDKSIYDPYPDGFQRTFLSKLDAGWESYASSDQDIIQYMISTAQKVLTKN